MILTAPMKNDLEIYERAAHAWWDGSDRTFRSLQRVKAFHLAELERLFGPELRGTSIVDLGCGGGHNGALLKRAGAREVVRFAEDAAVAQGGDLVGADDQVSGVLAGQGPGLPLSQAADQQFGVLAGQGALVDVRRAADERQLQAFEQGAAVGRAGCENQG